MGCKKHLIPKRLRNHPPSQAFSGRLSEEVEQKDFVLECLIILIYNYFFGLCVGSIGWI
jgi:hypothetical protein